MAAYRGGRDDEYLEDFDESSYPTMASPLAVAKYLMALRPYVSRAIEVRQSWIKELGLLFEEARQGNTRRSPRGPAASGASTSARSATSAPRSTAASPPRGAPRSQRSVVGWIDGMVKACEALIEVGNTGAMAGMQVAQRHVTEARHAARRFNSEYNRLVTEIKVAVRDGPARALAPRVRSAP